LLVEIQILASSSDQNHWKHLVLFHTMKNMRAQNYEPRRLQLLFYVFLTKWNILLISGIIGCMIMFFYTSNNCSNDYYVWINYLVTSLVKWPVRLGAYQLLRRSYVLTSCQARCFWSIVLVSIVFSSVPLGNVWVPITAMQCIKNSSRFF